MNRILIRNLLRGPLTEPAPPPDEAALAELAARVDRAARARLGRSLSIREVDAGSCNGCELEIHALNNIVYDLERFGLRFVASPRRCAAGHGPGHGEHAAGARAHLRGDAGSEMGRRRRPLRARWRRIRRGA